MGRRKDKLELNDGSFFLFELNVKTNRANKYLAFCSIGIVIYMTKLLHHDWPRGVQSIQSNGLLKDLGGMKKEKQVCWREFDAICVFFKVPIRGLGILHIWNLRILMRKIATYLVSRKIHLHILFCCESWRMWRQTRNLSISKPLHRFLGWRHFR